MQINDLSLPAWPETHQIFGGKVRDRSAAMPVKHREERRLRGCIKLDVYDVCVLLHKHIRERQSAGGYCGVCSLETRVPRPCSTFLLVLIIMPLTIATLQPCIPANP